MGREIRRVPAGWEHPRQECKHSPWAGGCDEAKMHGGYCYKPLYNKTYKDALAEYEAERAKWERGDFELSFGGPPDPDYYRPKFESEPTHYQVYQTVSEGTPVTPVFATEEEMIDYLATKGTFWDQKPSLVGRPARGGWGRENAEAFVRGGGWMPSLVISSNGRVMEPKDFLKKKE